MAMRILYVLPFVPWVGRVRSYHLIPRLGREHEIFLLCRSSSSEEEARGGEMEEYCKHVQYVRHPRTRFYGTLRSALALPTPIPLRMAYFASARMKKAVLQAISRFTPDIIYVERWRTLQWIPTGTSIPVIADPTDSMLLYNWRLIGAGSWWEKFVGAEEALKFLHYEPHLSKRSPLNIYCSDVDLECVRKRSPKSRFAVVCNGVDIGKFFFKQSDEEQDLTLVFSGDFNYRPNRHAVNFFLKEIFPIIRKNLAAAKFAIVGHRAKRYYGHLDQQRNVEVYDFVPELRPYLAKATVAVAPITVAVGVLTKLLEAFGVGTPVVATSCACTGLPVRDREHLFIADNAETFAERVVQLLLDRQLRRRLAINARKFVERNCNWDRNAARMEELMYQVAMGNAECRASFSTVSEGHTG
jgi:polysaccharide biosynthesis protein PslH